ncbi:acyl carrier protein [Streptosporangium longisporum]|uniref:Carrier domain-containing protein n=1 Tax=Streptosporangium longisporum TaxID=46187 RepID=A0ABP6L7I1_9ACTN
MVRERLAAMVASASDGAVTAGEALTTTVPLSALGFTSLAQMRLIDAVETEFGVEIDLSGDGLDLLDDLDALERHINEARGAHP